LIIYENVTNENNNGLHFSPGMGELRSLNHRQYTMVECNDRAGQINPGKGDLLSIAIIAEDLRLPLDEGAKKTTFSLITSLPREQVKVSVFTRFTNPLLKNSYPLPSNKFLVGGSLSRDLKSEKPDIILYIPSSSGTIGAFFRAAMIKQQSSRVPLAMLSLQYRKLPLYIRHFGLQKCVDMVFVQSHSSKDVFSSLGCHTTLLPGAVDQTIFHPISKTEKQFLRLSYHFQDTDQIVLHVGHCNRHRNVSVLTKLAELGFTVIMIASTSTITDPTIFDELRQSSVHVITNYVESIQHFYQMADCYVFPVFQATSSIDSPLSVLEAMACNIPVVTTRFGSLTGMFQPGNGFYFVDSEDELVNLVSQAVKEQDCKTSQMVAQFSWQRAGLTVLETLQKIINQ
jgi:glycosyltransferase involved in cell wall biosynthesis